MKVNGNFDGGVSSNGRKEKKKTRERGTYGSDFGLFKKRCNVVGTEENGRPSRDLRSFDKVKKQFSFSDNVEQSDCR